MGVNIPDLLWTYLVKTHDTKKARYVCNGQPKFKGTIIISNIFAKMKDNVGSLIFWGTVASKNLIVRGVDVSNAFAEARAHGIPLYVCVNTQCREWYKHKFNKDTSVGYVMPVYKSLQSHPESSYSWEIHMNKILKNEIHILPTRHGQCLYKGSSMRQQVLILRQVDDFAVASEDEQLTINLIENINTRMNRF